MAAQNQGPNMDQFELYFRRADLDQDGRISGPEAVSFFQGSGLPKQVLAQIWTYADQKRTGFLGRQEFYNSLKLVTVAQSKRDLTQELVQAALYGPASSKIPAPKINLGAVPSPQANLNVGQPALQMSSGAPAISQSMGIRAPQGFQPQQNQVVRPPRAPAPNPVFQPQQGGLSEGMPRGGTMVAPRPQSSSISSDWLGGGTGGPSPRPPMGGISPSVSLDGFGVSASASTPSVQPRPQATASLPQHVAKPNDPTSVANQPGAKDSNGITVSGNGFASNSMFGDAFSATSSQGKNGLPTSSANTPPSVGTQPGVRPPAFQGGVTQLPTGSQNQQGPPAAKQNHQVPAQNPSAFPVKAENSAAGQSQLPWPKMTPAIVQKYSKVFMEVDRDRDGKITGEEARNLFLSWRLPREVLKQVWDLSDQDNDSMLSLREFCIALYLMERYREGRPLPRVLPTGIMLEETPLPAPGHATAGYGAPSWRPTHGMQQQHGMPATRSLPPPAAGRPPRAVPIPHVDEDMQPRQQKAKVPVLEKHLIDQLSTEEQNSLNSKFQEATEADKKVNELEKEIAESKEKIEFYRSKMQEIIFYKSKCDNRLNEITERVSADKREVESLAKKYEEKYKQSGDVASKLTIEEATFRDIQEKKMELYRAILKLEQDGNADNMQSLVDRIQADLEEQVKALNERCKMYGLRAKPTSLLELPFGWQPGIQVGAADWDEDWDKFEDEGFTFVQELTLDIKNVIAPPKPKTVRVKNQPAVVDEGATAVSSSNANGDSEDLPGADDRTPDNGLQSKQTAETFMKTPPDSPASRNAEESPSKKFDDSPVAKHATEDGSPHAIETRSEHEGTESVLSGSKTFNEPGWGRFDIPFDTDWNLNPIKTKDTDNGNESSFLNFDPGEWDLNPIRTEVPKKGPLFDSVPGTPAYSYAGSPTGGDLFQKRAPFGFADSVPSTPAYSYTGSPRGENLFQSKGTFGFADSVPSTPAYGYTGSPQKKSNFFADSVPSTPMYSSSNSPRRFSDGPEDHSFNTFSRFDSFNSTSDGGLFPPRENFSRFDSFRSTTQDSEYDQGFYNPPREGSFARFDSMRSTADSDFGPSLFQPRDSPSFARFDSMRSTTDSSEYNHGFPSFDDTDPFGSSEPFRSNDPFRTSVDSQTPRRDSDSWKAF